MTAFDELLDSLAERIDRLPRPSMSALFMACAEALLPEYRRWAAHTGQDEESLARRALSAARGYALTGVVPPADLLPVLEQSTPDGEAPDEFSATAAQDFWICADVSIRVTADPAYDAGSGIEYALEPLVQQATERLFGVTQVGSGPEENDQLRQLLAEPEVSAAVAFCTWSTDHLNRPTLTEADLAELSRRATVLAPR